MKKLSGADWIRAFLGSSSTADLSMQFCPGVERFIKALKKGECLWDAAFARRTRIKPPAYGGNAIDRDISWRGILKIKMRNINRIILLCLAISGCAVANSPSAPPVNVKTFTDNADNCIHLSGEWDSHLSKERQSEIEKSVDQYCGKAKEQKEKLKVKYKNNTEVAKILSRYDLADIE